MVWLNGTFTGILKGPDQAASKQLAYRRCLTIID
jgi:hypothetical protein